MLERALPTVISSIGFDMGCIYLSDEDEELSLRVQKNLPESLKTMCIEGRFKDLFTKTLEKENIFYITPEVEEYESLEPTIKSNDIKTLLILPIKNEDIIGLLNMESIK